MMLTKILLVCCALVTAAAGMQLTSVTYRTHEVQIDNRNNFKAAVFTFTFDQSVNILGTQSDFLTPLNNLPAKNFSFPNYCFPPLSCVPATLLAGYLSNVMTLDCPSEQATPAPYLNTAAVPSNLIFFSGSTSEPFLNFFTQIGYISGYNTTVDDKRLYAFLVLSYTSNGIAHYFDKKFRTIESDLSSKSCKIRFDEENTPNYVLIGANDISPFYANFSNIVETAPSCSYFSTLTIASAISDTIDKMSFAPDYASLQLLQFKNALLKGSNALYGCEYLIESAISLKEVSVTFPNTTECVRNPLDPLYNQDPCCNITLQYIQCCAAASRDAIDFELNQFDYSKVKCKNIGKSSNLLADYIINTNNAEDPIEGCRTIAQADISDNSEKYLDFIDYCLYTIYGASFPTAMTYTTCLSDAQCPFSYCDKASGYCKFDVHNPDPYFLECHMQNMDPFVKEKLKEEWELPQNISISGFRDEYYTRFSGEACVGVLANTVNFYRDDQGKLLWSNAEAWRKDACQIGEYCNWGYGYVGDQESCESLGSACVVDFYGIKNLKQYPAYCFLSTVTNPEDCALNGGSWDPTVQPWSCFIQDIYTLTQCLPTNICGFKRQSDFFVQTQCSTPFCYSSATIMTKQRCQSSCNDSVVLTWVTDVRQPNANGGYCKITFPKQANMSDFSYCRSLRTSGRPYLQNAQWWEGRGWNEGYWNTKEQCDTGACMLGTLNYVDTKPANCGTVTGCTSSCSTCTSLFDVKMCVADDISQCNCTTLGGRYDPRHRSCSFGTITDEATCLAYNNSKWLTCEDLNKDQCDSCSQGSASCPLHYEDLNCQFALYGTCPDTDACLASGGICSDQFAGRAQGCNSITFSTPECQGICMTPLSPSSSGQWACQPGFVITELGCANYSIGKTECDSLPDYWWQESFLNKSACLEDKGCKNNEVLNGRGAEDCVNCGGEYDSLFTWTEGKVATAQLVPLEYIEAKWIPMNRWTTTLNYKNLRDTINRLVAGQYYRDIQSESKCLYNPLLEVISHFACDCVADPSNPTSCYNDGVRITSIGVQRFFVGVADSIRTNSIRISVFANSIQTNIPYLDMNIDIASATQFRLQQSLSIDALSSSLKTNPYAVIQNNFSIVVGQLVGDGAVLSFFPANQTNSRKRVGTPSFTLRNPIQVCVQLRSDITLSRNEYPVADFAISTDFVTFTPMEATVTETSFGYCIETLREGNFFPILRTSDWRTKTEANQLIQNEVVRIFIYIFGGIFILLAILSAYQMYRGSRTMVNCVPNLAFILFFFMLLFNLVRGIYLLVLPSGKLENNEAGRYFLSEAPQFFFFSVYTVIIFLWAELSTMIASKSFLYHFKYPFICTNAGLYILFIVSVSVFHTLDAKKQDTLQKVYVYILAISCFVAVVAFNWFGKKLLSIQIRVRKTRAASEKDSAFRRMAITMIVSSLALLAQIAFLFVITYDEVTPQIALVAYALTEILPSATLMYTLRPISRKQAEATGSTRRGTSGSKGSRTSNKTSSNDSKNTKNSNNSKNSSSSKDSGSHSSRAEDRSSSRAEDHSSRAREDDTVSVSQSTIEMNDLTTSSANLIPPSSPTLSTSSALSPPFPSPASDNQV